MTDPQPRENGFLAAALPYARLGWRVFPVTRGQKKPPLIRAWQRHATTDAGVLASWANQWPDANLAVATGPASGVLVLDIDGEAGEIALETFQDRIGRLAATCEQTTGRGRQLFFAYPSAESIRNTTALAGHRGLDTRGEGGYAIIPPSIHPSGKVYTWEASADPLNGGSLAQLPEPWIALLRGQDRADPARTSPSDLVEGERNNALFRLASSMRAQGGDHATIEAALSSENARRCTPPLEGDEVRRIAQGVTRYPAGQPKSAPAAEPWGPPVPLGRFDLPAFPTDAFPDELCVIREFCGRVSDSLQVPLDLPALLVLAVAGAALAKRVEVEVQPDWREPVNLFVAPALESGERKSTTFREVIEPLAQAERAEGERLGPATEQNRIDRDLLAKRIEYLTGKAAKATNPDERAQMKEEAQALAEELRTTPELLYPKLIAEDATPEAVGTLLYQQGGRIALLSPEGDTFDLMAGRYSGDRKPNLGVYLKGHAGDDLRVDRKGRPPEFVPRPALTVGLAIQPDVLRGLVDQPGFRGRGLLARFLYSLAPSRVGYRALRPEPVPPQVYRAYAELIHSALAIEAVGGPSGPEPHIVTVGAEALEHLDRFRAETERSLRPDGELAMLRDWGSKLPGAVCRIAGIFHGLIHARSSCPEAQRITAETMLCAIAIGEYAIPHARAAFFEMGADPAVGLARRLLAWIADKSLPNFSRRDAFNALRGGVERVEQVDRPLQLLEDHGYIRGAGQQVEYGRRGRKPSPRYDVNPHAYGQNAHIAQNLTSEGNSADSAQSAGGTPE